MKIVVISIALLAGCVSAANKAQVNATRVNELKTRAAFDLKCDQAQLAVTDLTAPDALYMKMAGVEGCGQRATYAFDVHRSMWFMDAARVPPPTANATGTEATP